MSDPEYVRALATAGVFYFPLSAGQSAPLSKTLWLIGKDLGAHTLVAQARKTKGVGEPIFTMSAVVQTNENRTWQALVDDNIISYVPYGKAATDEVAVMGIILSANQAQVDAAYTSANPALGKSATMDWEMVAQGADTHIVASGPLTITPGIIA